MKITKYEHACWVVEDGDNRIVIDPGIYSTSLTDLNNITALVITHIHSDHLDPEKIKNIMSANPDVKVFSTEQVKQELGENIIVPEIGKEYKVQGCSLEFFGGQHEFYTEFQNIAVLVNEKFYSPGDSYTKPNKPVAVAAVPVSAPWLRVREAVENLKAVPAKIVTPTHDILLSEAGRIIHFRQFKPAAQEAGKKWQELKPGESIEI